MKFNQDKSKIMLHNKIQNYQENEEIKGIKVVRSTKVLGYMLDAHCNNLEHIKHIKKKIEKA